MKNFPDKQPSELLDYDFIYSDWFVDGDFLVNAVVSIEDMNSGYKLTMKTKAARLEDLLSGLVSGEFEIEGINGTISPRAIISFFVVSEEFVKVWVSEGTDGEKYKITCIAEAHSGRIKESEATLKIKER